MEKYEREMTKQDNKMAKGLAILAMVSLHLFCRLGDLPYKTLINIGGTPLIYYFGLFGDICVPIYAILSGYAHYREYEIHEDSYVKILKRLKGFIIQYWIVLFWVVCIGVFFDASKNIPGSFAKFLSNFLLINLNYCGAWWYVQIYILLNVFSKVLYRAIRKSSLIIGTTASLFVYCVAYYFRFIHPVEVENMIAAKVISIIVLFGTTVFPYLMGMILRKYKIISLLREKGKPMLIGFAVLTGIVFLLHCKIQTVFVAPFTGIVTLIAFLLWQKNKYVQQVFLLLGKHSTNIWLIHMFFYLNIFKDFVFVAKYPLFILLFMFALCILVSWMLMSIHLLLKKACNKISMVRR